jgi:hypothetical protein
MRRLRIKVVGGSRPVDSDEMILGLAVALQRRMQVTYAAEVFVPGSMGAARGPCSDSLGGENDASNALTFRVLNQGMETGSGAPDILVSKIKDM